MKYPPIRQPVIPVKKYRGHGLTKRTFEEVVEATFKEMNKTILIKGEEISIDKIILKKAKELAYLAKPQWHNNRIILVACAIYLASIMLKMPLTPQIIEKFGICSATSIKVRHSELQRILENTMGNLDGPVIQATLASNPYELG